jgi:hypothetical protein
MVRKIARLGLLIAFVLVERSAEAQMPVHVPEP